MLSKTSNFNQIIPDPNYLSIMLHFKLNSTIQQIQTVGKKIFYSFVDNKCGKPRFFGGLKYSIYKWSLM